jgi:hypothetical protein
VLYDFDLGASSSAESVAGGIRRLI